MKKETLWQPYPEELRTLASGELQFSVSIPDHPHVVMGASGKPEKEVFIEALRERHIPLYKRKGGGGTVLLGPNTIVVTIHADVVHPFHNLGYFSAVNRALMAVFGQWADLDYRERGISDIAIGQRKILGSSIYRRKQYLLYQASLLVDLDLDLMEKVLRYPPKEPDYRQGRAHADFVTSLRENGVQIDAKTLAADLRSNLRPFLQRELDRANRAASS
ncbi:BPL/LPL catalytic domain-containing protein [Sulfidibacter corallicola]|uniref:BPL/LPL catalytic domain-containing protein n=1 Tax=Sulfidibacter corallicola TaxID=2818388 RepID=A0A8A4TF00_SULCO|nr:hypothetical protein [Sulfidibacter corallicola]QTD48117.1 hypothetical protein J3U87_21235 [Sulfidibacter corallicola]